MRRTYKNKSRKRSGGAATAFPASYFNPGAKEPSAAAGRDLLGSMSPIGVRPKIGGRRKTRKTRGGFVPSVMEGFVAAASKYIVPIALFAGYKLMTRKQKKSSRRRK